MGKVATGLIHEAFIEPIRFAFLLDDKFPIYPNLSGGDFDPALDNKRAATLFTLCRDRGWLCDVDNRGTVAEQFELQKHLHQSNLLILDFNLDPLDQDDPTTALRILQKLAASDHFNLVVVYTSADPQMVARDMVYSLGGGPEVIQAAKDRFDIRFEDLDQDTEQEIQNLLSWPIIDGCLTGRGPGDASAALRACLQKAEFAPREISDAIMYLAAEFMSKRLKPGLLESRPTGAALQSSVGKPGDLQWVAQGNVFVAIVNKDEAPGVLIDRLVEALEAWDPSPLHVMMVHARAAMDRAGTVADRKVLATPRLQAGWLLKILLGQSDSEHKEGVGELYGRLFERIVSKVEESIVDFGIRLIGPVAVDDPVSRAKVLAGAVHNMGADKVYHALNEHAACDEFTDGQLTTGVIFRASKLNRDGKGEDHFWLCTSPACDLVPGQNMRGLDGELHPLRPVSLARLRRISNQNSVGEALRVATHGRHIFVEVDGNSIALEVVDEISRQMDLEIALIEQDGEVSGGVFYGHTIELGAQGVPNFNRLEFRAIAKLRPDYANRLLSMSGQQKSRIGVDFFNLPKPANDQNLGA